METLHTVFFADSRNLGMVGDGSVDLVVTSPPYPMIEMWDPAFSAMAGGIGEALAGGAGDAAFEMMHAELDKVWRELARVTKNGAFVCVNIGDATRTLGGAFQLYSNHSRVILAFKKAGFTTLPLVLWRKQTNAPNKFMGSGMLPAGAYVTLEHEYILIFRKGGKRLFPGGEAKTRRMQSAFFWEERNTWFSDVWDFKGIRQNLDRPDLRRRSAAFPFELAWRLVNMYSLREDLVLDPFAGTGTTLRAAAAAGRNSIGVEIDRNFGDLVFSGAEDLKQEANRMLEARLRSHAGFLASRLARGAGAKHSNAPHGFPVVTRQETGLRVQAVEAVTKEGEGTLRVRYRDFEWPLAKTGTTDHADED
ncbi:MAG: site-specific DNA-methyltransferase [Spirochaetia bacterium]|jgi:DNA modification methylase|nr:site-specific DNA-methyltransferase [Spirochaetia bacterium]